MLNVIPLRVAHSSTHHNDTNHLFRIDLHRKIILFEAISRNVRTQLIGCLLLYSKKHTQSNFRIGSNIVVDSSKLSVTYLQSWRWRDSSQRRPMARFGRPTINF